MKLNEFERQIRSLDLSCLNIISSKDELIVSDDSDFIIYYWDKEVVINGYSCFPSFMFDKSSSTISFSIDVSGISPSVLTLEKVNSINISYLGEGVLATLEEDDEGNCDLSLRTELNPLHILDDSFLLLHEDYLFPTFARIIRSL